jgi:hypothetical protein
MIIENLRFLVEGLEVELLETCSIFVLGRATAWSAPVVVNLTTLSMLAAFVCELFATVWSFGPWIKRKSGFGVSIAWLLERHHVRMNNVQVLRQSVCVGDPSGMLH